MAGLGGTVLYTPEILALAVELAGYPLSDTQQERGEARSRVCGSRVVMGVAAGSDGAIREVGARVTACAIGQAAAALFLRAAAGRGKSEIADTLEGLEAWLGGTAPTPGWPGLDLLEPARAYPARHPAILLPWKAALSALSNPSRSD